jgi:DNA gyrase subunit B
MTRDYAAEIDSLREELTQLKKLVLRGRLPKIDAHSPSGESSQVLDDAGRTQLDDLKNQLIAYTEASNESGAISYVGTFRSVSAEETRQSIWASVIRTDFLLGLNENRMVEKVLTSVGNSQRLAILLALLKKPLTVNELVDCLGAKTTGQIYHHLKPLVSADIIKEEKGVYAVIPYRVQGLVMLLAGVCDLVDARYTSGTWEDQASLTNP